MESNKERNRKSKIHYKEDAFRIGIASGCYSILTAGHVHYFSCCKKLCDYLIVLTNTDDRIQRKKGCVPISLPERLEILSSIRYINEVSYFPQVTEDFWIDRFIMGRMKIDFPKNTKLLIFHSEEVRNNPPAKHLVDKIIFIPRSHHSSTSQIIERIKGE